MTMDPVADQAVNDLNSKEQQKGMLIQMRLAILADISKLKTLAEDEYFGDFPMMEMPTEMMGPDGKPLTKTLTPKEAVEKLKEKLDLNLKELNLLGNGSPLIV